VAKIDGREVQVNVPAGKDARTSNASWQAAGSRLGQDVAVVLKSMVKPLPDATIESIVERLSGSDPVKRAQAANQAARLGAEGTRVVPALLAVLADDRPLRQIGGRGIDTTPALQAGRALNALGAHTELLAYFRSETKGHARANALAALASGLAKGYRDVILEALDDDNGDVRTAAAGLAGHYVGPAAAPKLIDILERERNRAMREAARRSLSRLAGKDFELDAAAWRQWWTGQAQARAR
jgi:HEAT repeat protein